MKTQKSTAFEIATTFITKMFFLGGSFMTSIILARVLGREGKGMVTALFVIPNLVISLSDLGVRQASAYYIGRKIHPIEDIAASNMLLWGLTSVLSVIIVAGYYFSPFSSSYSTLLIIIALAYIPVKILTAYFSGMLQGRQMIKEMNMKYIIESVSKLLIVILVVWLLTTGVPGAALATTISATLALIYSWLRVREITPLKFYYAKGIPEDLLRKGFVFALAIFILQLNYKIDIVFLESMVSLSDVGVYSVGVTLAELIWQVPTAISTVLFARTANSTSDLEASERTAKLLRISLPPLLLMSLAMWGFSPLFVRLFFGTDFIQAGTVIRLLLPGIVMMVLHQVLYADISGKGQPLLVLNIYIVTLVINVLLNMILIPLWGINGAALASTISYTISAMALSVKYRKFSGLSYRDIFVLNKNDINLIAKKIKR